MVFPNAFGGGLNWIFERSGFAEATPAEELRWMRQELADAKRKAQRIERQVEELEEKIRKKKSK